MSWADLLEELLSLVVSKLLPKDREIFGLVCRSWNAFVTHSPTLMFYNRRNREFQFIQPNNRDVYTADSPQAPYDADICCSKYGWLLIMKHDSTLLFFDPLNRMTIEVPSPHRNYTTISFFHPPTSPNCFILGITDSPSDATVPNIGMLKRGEDEWTSYSYDSTKFPFSVPSCTPVLHHGLLYCVDLNGNIVTFNINEHFSRRSWMSYTKCLPQLCGIVEHFLFKINGRETIFAVFVLHKERKVNVYKLKEPEMKWQSVEDLGDNMLFLSRSVTLAVTAPIRSMRNRIYFPMLHGDNCVFYSLSTQKFHSVDGEYTNTDFYGLKELRFATWYKPSPTPELKRLPSWNL